MTNEKGYNGYTNYETWIVALWMNNDRGVLDYWLSVITDLSSADSPEYIANENTQKCRLADRLKDEHEENQLEVSGVYADLLGAALSKVKWLEIAENLINTRNAEQEEEGAQ